MATLRQRLAERIAAEDAEIARIQHDATANLAAARRRKTILETAAAKLDEQPDLETLLGLLNEAGVKVVE